MVMAESDQLVEVLKEIRDELRAVRTELADRGPRMTTSGVRTAVVGREGRRRTAALAGGGVACLALVIALAMRDRPAPSPVAVAPQDSAAKPAMPPSAVIPSQAQAIPAAPMAAHAAMPVAKSPAAAPATATRQAAHLPTGVSAPASLASVPAPAKKRVRPDVAAKPPAEVASDEDETLAFPPPPRRVRVHRLSYGPVESEPAKL
jgi:hypothetical protein